MRPKLSINLSIGPARNSHRAPRLIPLQSFGQNAAMFASGGIEHDQISFLGANADIDFPIRPDRQAARVHFARMHSAEVFHRVRLWVESNQLGVWVSAGVKLAIFARVELPKVIFR